ncbi:MAG: SseB family protein, partial [Acetatifactor sp.]|nr:SseB family protein [Acetatifactor sp.]
KQFFMAFTDAMELKKWKNHEDQQTAVASFEDYAGLLFKKDGNGQLPPAIGFVINPFGDNIIVPREMIAQYMAARAEQMQNKKPTV